LSCMANHKPGSPDLSVLSFKNGFHGRLFGSLSTTRSKAIHKIDVPAFDWPAVEFPILKYPFSEFKKENAEAEAKCLEEVESTIKSWSKFRPVAAMIVEPIQSEGGDNHFRSEFLHGLRKLADEFDILLVFDEVQSGMGITGKFWAFEHLGVAPDILCFGKKAQICGIMATDRIDHVDDHVFQVPSRINSTWGGNLTDMFRSRRLLEIVEEENLVENARVVGEYLLHSLLELQAKFPSHMSSTRGRGLLCAFDVPSKEHCKLIKDIGHEKGVMLLSCGARTIRLRPVLDVKRADIDELMRILPEIFHAIEERGSLPNHKSL